MRGKQNMGSAFKLFLSFAAIVISMVNAQCALSCSLQKPHSAQAAMHGARHACCPQERAPKKNPNPCTRPAPEPEITLVERTARPALVYISQAACPVLSVNTSFITGSPGVPLSSAIRRLTLSFPPLGIVLRI